MLRATPISQLRRLRAVLKSEREALGLTQQDVADALDWASSKIVQIENGPVDISITDLRALLLHYRVARRSSGHAAVLKVSRAAVVIVSLLAGQKAVAPRRELNTRGQRVILAVAITRRTGSFDQIFTRALEECGLEEGWDRDPLIEREDGCYCLFYPSVSRIRLLFDFVQVLYRLLLEHNRSDPENAFGLRLAFNSGEVEVAVRLVDSGSAKSVELTPESPLLVIVSQRIYEDIVDQYFDSRDDFVRIRQRDRRNDTTYYGWAWVVKGC